MNKEGHCLNGSIEFCNKFSEREDNKCIGCDAEHFLSDDN